MWVRKLKAGDRLTIGQVEVHVRGVGKGACRLAIAAPAEITIEIHPPLRPDPDLSVPE